MPVAVGLFVLSCTATAQQPDVKKKTDLELIQGTWWVVGLESGGKQQSDKGSKGNSFVFSKVKGVNTAVLIERAYPPVEFTYALDPAKTPREINLTTKGNRALGIYKLDGDDLTICMSMGGSRPSEFATRAGGDTETFTLKRNRWERYTEKGLGFSIDFPGRPSESKRTIDAPGGAVTVRVLSVRSDVERITYSVTVTPLAGKLAPSEVESVLDLAQKTVVAELDRDAEATVEAESKLTSAPAGVSSARELTVTMRLPQSRDRGTMRVRLYVAGEKLIALAVNGTEEVARSPSVTRFWNSFRIPGEKRKDFPNKER